MKSAVGIEELLQFWFMLGLIQNLMTKKSEGFEIAKKKVLIVGIRSGGKEFIPNGETVVKSEGSISDYICDVDSEKNIHMSWRALEWKWNKIGKLEVANDWFCNFFFWRKWLEYVTLWVE